MVKIDFYGRAKLQRTEHALEILPGQLPITPPQNTRRRTFTFHTILTIAISESIWRL